MKIFNLIATDRLVESKRLIQSDCVECGEIMGEELGQGPAKHELGLLTNNIIVSTTPKYCKYYRSDKSNIQKIFEGEMLIKIQCTTLLQISCEFVINSKVIFKST